MKQTTRNRAGRPVTTLALAALLVSVAGVAGADPALHVRYGDPATALSPEIDAMAGTGTALYRGGYANVLNPAMLSAAEPGKLRVDAGASFVQAHEDRFQPLFDTFTSYVTDIAIASNRHHFFGSGFALARRLPELAAALAAGVSLTDRYDFAYDFSEQVRDPNSYANPYDAVLSERAVGITGALRDLAGGFAVDLSPGISLGASAHYVFGKREETHDSRDFRTPTASLLQQTSFDMGGLNFTFGARLHVDERLEIGFAYESPLSVTGKTSASTWYGAHPDSVNVAPSTAGVDYPRSWRAGFCYRPRTAPRTIFTADAAIREWTDLRDTRLSGENPLLLQDAVDVSIGLEHRFYNGLPVRFGFRRLESYDDREAGATFFTTGLGLDAGGGEISVSAELSKTTSIREHWFAYPAGYVSDAQARVEDTRFRLGVGYTRAF